MELKVGSDPNDMPAPARSYYGALTSAARKEMTTTGIDCPPAKELAAARTPRKGVEAKDAYLLG